MARYGHEGDSWADHAARRARAGRTPITTALPRLDPSPGSSVGSRGSLLRLRQLNGLPRVRAWRWTAAVDRSARRARVHRAFRFRADAAGGPYPGSRPEGRLYR